MSEYKQQASAHEEPRRISPVENGVMACASASIGAVLLALLIERPLMELWRWLVGGALLALGVLTVRYLVPPIVELAEVLSRHDFSGDGVIGKPHPVLVNPRQGQQVARQQSEAEYKAEFAAFIRGCERSTSERTWSKRGIQGTKYEGYRDALIGAGYAAWKNDDQRQGWRLLLPAELVIEEMWRA